MAKKKAATSGKHITERMGMFLPAEMRPRIEQLRGLIEREMPIRVKLTATAIVIAAIEEAIARREEGNGKSQP